MSTPDEQEQTFSRFGELPQELRDKIWMYCLPHRICEDGFTLGRLIWEQMHRGQQWDLGIVMHSRARNRLPPVIAQVCRESRKVVYFAGRLQDDDRERLRLGTYKYNFRGWEDRSRDTFYLDNFPWYSTWASIADVLEVLATRSRYMQVALSQAILTNLNALDSSAEGDARDTARVDSALRILAQSPWIGVVLYDYEIIADVPAAQRTGLFGICGDAYCQVIDVAGDWDKIEQFYACAKQTTTRTVEEFMSPEESQQCLDKLLAKCARARPLIGKLRPAVNVQLCDEELRAKAFLRTLQHNMARMRFDP